MLFPKLFYIEPYCKENWVYLYISDDILNLHVYPKFQDCSKSVAEQAGLSLPWWKMTKTLTEMIRVCFMLFQ